MKKFILLIVLIIFTGLFSCTGSSIHNPDSINGISADDVMYHIAYLAGEELQGRLPATAGDTLAVEYIADTYKTFGLKPAGDNSTFLQKFEFIGGLELEKNNIFAVKINGEKQNFTVKNDYMPLSFSSNGRISGKIVFVGYGISAPELKYDDYEGIDVTDAIVLALRFSPARPDTEEDLSDYEPLKRKTQTAREKGAAGIMFVTGPSEGEDDKLPKLNYSNTTGNSGIPVLQIKRNTAEKLLEISGMNLSKLEKTAINKKTGYATEITGISAEIKTALKQVIKETFNVAGFLEGNDPVLKDEYIVIGGHYDHLGFGGPSSRLPEKFGGIHNGADDNASGVAGILEMAQYYSSVKKQLKRSILFIAFGAEELGVLGSTHFVDNPYMPLDKIAAMLNFDMIGRMKNNELILIGVGSSPLWETSAAGFNKEIEQPFTLSYDSSGFGGSDHSSFYRKDIPVLFLTTGAHEDYHMPSDDIEKIDKAGAEKILKFATGFIDKINESPERPKFTKVVQSQPMGRPSFRVTLGVVPHFGGNVKGFKISSVKPGEAADRAGIKGGDVIISMAGKEIMNIQEYMYSLSSLKPGQTVEVIVDRNGEKKTFKVNLAKNKRNK